MKDGEEEEEKDKKNMEKNCEEKEGGEKDETEEG